MVCADDGPVEGLYGGLWFALSKGLLMATPSQEAILNTFI